MARDTETDAMLVQLEIENPRFASCSNCGNSFTYDTTRWPTGIEPEYCAICMSDLAAFPDFEVETNWLTTDESAASNIKTRAQKRYIDGGDPLDVYRESDGWNGVKELEGRTDDLAERRREHIRENLIAGVAPFTDPRSNPRLD